MSLEENSNGKPESPRSTGAINIQTKQLLQSMQTRLDNSERRNNQLNNRINDLKAADEKN